MCGDVADSMESTAPARPDERGCVYVLDVTEGDRRGRFCGAGRRPGSPYCPDHHARCRLRGGSAAERRRLREIEALAAAAGGKHVLGACQPSAGMLRRLERSARNAYSRANRSRIVRKGAGDAADG